MRGCNIKFSTTLTNSVNTISQIEANVMSRYSISVLLLVAVASVHCARTIDYKNIVYDGRDVSPSQQCVDKHFGAACKTTDPSERCSHLKCTYLGRGDIPIYSAYDVGPALQGTPCGVNKICIGAKCVNDPASANSVADISTEIDCIIDDEDDDYL